jgi:hypothetical protein
MANSRTRGNSVVTMHDAHTDLIPNDRSPVTKLSQRQGKEQPRLETIAQQAALPPSQLSRAEAMPDHTSAHYQQVV